MFKGGGFGKRRIREESPDFITKNKEDEERSPFFSGNGGELE